MNEIDDQEKRLQAAYDEARRRLEPWVRRQRKHPIEATPASEVHKREPAILSPEELELAEKSFEDERKAWEDWKQTLSELRAYRAANERE